MKGSIFIHLSLVICCNCSGQDNPWKTSSALGGQLGYSYLKASAIDLGVNYQWAIYKFNKDITKNNTCHTLGIFLSATGIFANNNFYVGKQIGLNYHYGTIIAPRINVVYEKNFNDDSRIGGNLGINYFGFFLYGGYYHPIGKAEESGISRYRIGIRFILNVASLDAVPVS